MKERIVLLTKDALCKSYLPIYGNKRNNMPNLSELAAKGTVFNRFYTCAPSTAMSFIGMFTQKSAHETAQSQYHSASTSYAPDTAEEKERKQKRAFAIGFYIACPIPLFILSELGLNTMGLCFTLLLVAAATILLIQNSPKKAITEPQESAPLTPRQELRKSVSSLIWALGLALYFILSFVTHAWYITWVMFPIIGAVQGLARAILDLMEVKDYEA